ncbi:hypothetical protein EYC84_002508 [Monilinia fructicola]|uniref:Uncharacterized protein n=1 Tax=Monilinia fructicola TaxID=38448 RepID=A0A5M9JL26_MONFR|nr:hypothetical protein EYC84_002508 [Monilinia fructicola]
MPAACMTRSLNNGICFARGNIKEYSSKHNPSSQNDQVEGEGQKANSVWALSQTPDISPIRLSERQESLRAQLKLAKTQASSSLFI